MSPVIPPPFQLLELNVISGQDLAQVSRKMQTYAVAWVNPDRKLSTRVDLNSHNNPTWNDKFMFRVDDNFLFRETSAIMIEIYANHWFRDVHVGTVRVIVGNLIPPADHKHHRQHGVQLGMRFVALQVRRRSGRPQGILNIGVALLDASKRSMPLYTQTASAGYRHVMGENNKDHNYNKEDDKISNYNQNQLLLPWIPKPQLRRTKSDTSSMIGSDLVVKRIKGKPSSMVNAQNMNKKESSDIVINKGQKRKPDKSGFGALTKAKYGSDTSKTKTNGKPNSNIDNHFSKFNGFDLGKLQNGGGEPPLITESELGPSASEVAAAMMKNKYRVEETESEIMGSWSLENSMEGLQSKLERWRTELPPVYDRSNQSSYVTSSFATGGVNRYNRRHSDGGVDEVFSCFSSVCGMQCSIVCGRTTMKEKKGQNGAHQWIA